MAKKKPPNTVTHQVFLPDELHRKVTALANYGQADDFIVECLMEAIEPRRQQWLEKEVAKTRQTKA
jgi:hypothetical protein